MDAVDRERLALAERLEVPAVPFAELLHRFGFTAEGLRTAGVINGIDYARAGLTIEGMGLAGRSADEIRAHAG